MLRRHFVGQRGFAPILSLLMIIVLAVGIFVIVRYLEQHHFFTSHASGLTLTDLQSNFVTESGTQFYIAGQQFRYVGVNMYDLASSPDTHNYDCGPVYSDADLDKSFSYFQQHGISVVRFWAFQTYIKGAASTADWSHYATYGPDWSGIDRAISYARKYGIKLIPVLENTSPDCTEGGAHWFASWFTTGYQQPYGNYPMSYPDWVKLIVTRYKADPTIMSWMLMNEAGDEEPIPADWTPASNTSMGVYNFTQSMSQLIKSIDSKHLVTLGTIDGNRGGIGGPAYIYIHKLPTIDYVEVHDYGNDTSALPGSVNNDGVTLPQNCSQTIACIVWEATHDIQKPVIVGEAGINVTAGDTQSEQTRANEFNAKISAFFNAGGAGYMIWHWDPNVSSGMDFSPGDPLVSVLQQFGITLATASPSSTSGFVTTSGTSFLLNGQPFKFVGFNLFDAASTTSYQCAWWPRFSDSELDSAFQYMHDTVGATVVRFWAYQTYTQGGTDWSGVDRVIATAKKYNMKVIPVLEDGPGYCTTGPSGQAKWQYNNDTWYTQGYKVPYGTATLSYRDYVAKIVAQYKDEPTILGWMMMNEADTSAKNSSGKSVLVDFATDIGSLIKSIDQNHLVTVGTQSNGASGATGSDFAAVYSLPQIDFAEAHDYGYWASLTNDLAAGEQDPLPGSADGITLPNPNSTTCQAQYQLARIACSIAMAKQIVQKPIIIGESGISLSRWSQAQRAQLFDNKMHAAFANNVAGYIVWQFNKVYDTGDGPYDVVPPFEAAANGQTDPLFAVMAKYGNVAAASSTPQPTSTPLPTATPVPTPTPVPTTPTPAPTSSPVHGNELQNPSFESVNGTSQSAFNPWWLEIKTGASAGNTADTSTKVDGAQSARIDVSQTSAWWNVQMFQPNIPVTNGQTYTIKFWAKASAIRTMEVVLQQYTSPNTVYMNQSVNLTTSWQQYTLTYTSTVTDPTALFVFNVGDTTGSVWLDNTSLVAQSQVSPTPAPKIGDLNNDGSVNITDFSILLSDWNHTTGNFIHPQADLNGDGVVNIIDFSILLSHWGT